MSRSKAATPGPRGAAALARPTAPWLAALACAGLLLAAADWPLTGSWSALPWLTAWLARAGLALLGTPLAQDGGLLVHAQGYAAQVHRDCTVLWPALLLLPGMAAIAGGRATPVLRMLVAMAAGVAWLAVVNQLRLIGVIWLGVHGAPAQAVVHAWVGPGMIAVGLALAWWAWARRLRRA